jgi:hypothetical protein
MPFDLSTAKPVSGGFDLSTAKPVAEDQGEPSLLDSAKHAVSVTGRDILSAAAALPLSAADLATGVVNVGRRIAGVEPWPSASENFQAGMDSAGLDRPQTAREQLVSAATRGAVAAASGAAAAGELASATTGTTNRVYESLAANPGLQSISGATAGGSGELARQEGAGPGGQLLASMAGGLAPAAIQSAAATITQPAQYRNRVEPTLGKDALPGQIAAPSAQVVEDAAAAGAQKLGLDWSKVDQSMQDQIKLRLQQSIALGSDLPPEAIIRDAVYKSQGLQTTRALVTRNFEDALNEQNLLTTPEGGPLRAVYDANNSAIRDRLKELTPEGVQAVDPPTFGAQFREPIAKGERAAQAASNEAYTAAQAAEGGNNADITKLNTFLSENAGKLNNRPASSGLTADLKDLGLMRSEATSPEMNPASPQFTLRKLASARAATNEAWQTAKNTGDTVATNRLNELRGILDEMEANAGGDLYKAYRTIRMEKGGAFENNPLIDKLISDKKGYIGTNMIEDSDVFDSAVLKSSTEQFNKAWPLLSKSAQDLTRAQLGKYIEDKVFSNMATNESGDIVASAPKLVRALEGINPQKLELIYGEKKAGDLQLLAKSLREISSPPKGTVPQGSAPKIEMLTRTLLGALKAGAKLPSVVGNTLGGIANVIKSGVDSKNNQRAVEDVLNAIPESSQVQVPRRLQIISPGAAPLLTPLERLQAQ